MLLRDGVFDGMHNEDIGADLERYRQLSLEYDPGSNPDV